MDNTKPDPPGSGRIVLETDGRNTSVDFTEMDGHTIASLFYHAILYNSICYVAMQKALEMYRNNNLS